LRAKSRGDDRRVDGCLPVCEAAEGVDKVRDVEDAFLEQVADPFGMFYAKSSLPLPTRIG